MQTRILTHIMHMWYIPECTNPSIAIFVYKCIVCSSLRKSKPAKHFNMVKSKNSRNFEFRKSSNDPERFAFATRTYHIPSFLSFPTIWGWNFGTAMFQNLVS